MAWSVFALTLVLGVSCGRPPVTNRAKLERQEAVERHQAQIDPPAINLSNSSLQSFCQQRLDHFNKTNQKTWCQRFAVDDSFYQRGERSVVFLCVGGEDRPWGTSGWPHLQTCNNMVQLAPRFNALLLCLEHRHYGGYDFDAVPKFDLEGLHFLSSRQALEDVAAFRVYAAEVLDLQTATWVTFGGSYSGALSAWARLLYPDLFHAAVSSSAPMESQLNFRGYHDVVASSQASPHVGGTPQCLATITKGHAQLRELLRTTLGRRSLEKKFNLCGHRPLDDSNNVAGWAGMGVITSNQYNNNRCSITSCNIRLLCGNLSLMSEALPSELDALVELDRFQQEEAVATGAVQSVEKCKDISWNGYLESLQIQEKRTDGSNLMGLWTYQICTEWGNFMTCEEDSNCPWTRGYNDMSFWFDMCETAFGFNESDVRHHVATTNGFYAGTRFPGGSHVVFANGEVDPWHWLSILVPPGGAEANIDTIWVPGASHCQWMQNTWDSMPRALHAAKEAIQNRIALWIS